jgi:hypothetical protein
VAALVQRGLTRSAASVLGQDSGLKTQEAGRAARCKAMFISRLKGGMPGRCGAPVTLCESEQAKPIAWGRLV